MLIDLDCSFANAFTALSSCYLLRAFITGKYDVGGLCNGNLALIPSLLYYTAFVRNWLMLIDTVRQFQDCYTDVSQVCNLTIFGRFKVV